MKPWTAVLGSIFLIIALFTWSAPSFAEPLLHDPHGFHDLRWGVSLGDRTELERKEFTSVHEGSIETMAVYELKGGGGALGGVDVDLIRFFTINGQFIRAAVHYTGQGNHKQLLAYLQSEFGPLERSLTQRGYRIQCVWMGQDTEITLTYNFVIGPRLSVFRKPKHSSELHRSRLRTRLLASAGFDHGSFHRSSLVLFGARQTERSAFDLLVSPARSEWPR